MPFSLSLSTNPFVNRFAEPEDLAGVLAGEVGIARVQLTPTGPRPWCGA